MAAYSGKANSKQVVLGKSGKINSKGTPAVAGEDDDDEDRYLNEIINKNYTSKAPPAVG